MAFNPLRNSDASGATPTGNSSTTAPPTGTSVSSSTWDGYAKIEAIADNATAQYQANAYSVSGWTFPNFNPVDCCMPAMMMENVTETQVVTGTWHSGYDITYENVSSLMVEFLPSAYTVLNVTVSSLPDGQVSISYTQQEQGVISLALSNQTLLQRIDISQYYVSSVEQVPLNSGNQTFAGDYLVYLDQINGMGTAGVTVDPQVTSVLGIW